MLVALVGGVVPGSASPWAAGPDDERRSLAEAAGDAAWERGWSGRAREAWSEALATAGPDEAARLRDRLARLDGGGRRVSCNTVDPCGPGDLLWRASPSAAGRHEQGGAPAPAVVGGSVAWSTGRAVHAVLLADGRPPWRRAREDDTLVFPPGGLRRRGGGGTPALPVAVHAAAIHAVVDDPLGESAGRTVLVRLDMSPAAEGRLDWAVRPPDVAGHGGRTQPTEFAGPPAADDEIVCAVLRTLAPADWLALACFDAHDGSVRWTRPLGTSVASDGTDRASWQRAACLAEDRIVVATHAGSVVSFTRDGRHGWSFATPAPMGQRSSAAPPDVVDASPPLMRGGMILAAPIDCGGLFAIEARGGRLLWSRGVGHRITLDDASADVAYAAERATDARSDRLIAISVADGSERAAFPAGDVTPSRSAGRAILLGEHVLWPAAGAGRTLLHVLDAVTLRPCAPPSATPLEPLAADATVRLAATPRGIVAADDATIVATGWPTRTTADAGQERGP